MRALYEIGADESELRDLMLGLAGEVTDDEIGAKLEAYMENLTEERDEKIRRICGLIANLEIDAESSKAQAAAIEEEIKDLKRAAKVAENSADRLKNRVKNYFIEHDIRRLDLGIFKPNVRGNSIAPLIVPKRWEDHPAEAPGMFHSISLDKAGIGLTIKLGSTNGHDRLCPKCGGFADVVDREAVIDDVKTEIPTAVCLDCKWEGKPDETARFGPKGTHLRLR